MNVGAHQSQTLSLPRCVVFIVFVLMPFITFAQNSNTLGTGWLKPGNPLYFLDHWTEKAQLFLTRDPEKKVSLNLQFAEEKMNEAAHILSDVTSHTSKPPTEREEQKKQKLVEQALENFDQYTRNLQTHISDEITNLQLLDHASDKTLEFIQRIGAFQVPLHLQSVIEKRKPVVEQGHLEVLKKYMNTDTEKGIEKAVSIMRVRAERVAQDTSGKGIEQIHQYRQLFEAEITENPNAAHRFSEQMLLQLPQIEDRMRRSLEEASQGGQIPEELRQKALEFQNKLAETHRKALDEITQNGNPGTAFQHYQKVIQSEIEQAQKMIEESGDQGTIHETLRRVDDRVFLYDNFRQRVEQQLGTLPPVDDIRNSAKKHREETLQRVIEIIPPDKRPVLQNIIQKFEEQRVFEGFDVSAPQPPEDFPAFEMHKNEFEIKREEAILHELRDSGFTEEQIETLKKTYKQEQEGSFRKLYEIPFKEFMNVQKKQMPFDQMDQQFQSPPYLPMPSSGSRNGGSADTPPAFPMPVIPVPSQEFSEQRQDLMPPSENDIPNNTPSENGGFPSAPPETHASEESRELAE